MIRKMLKWAAIVVGLVVLMLLSYVAYLFIAARWMHPTDVTLNAPHGEVKIHFDQNGVPHIVAEKNDLDAFYALGYVHAMDRLWQMTFQKHVVSGRLSEIFGSKTVIMDEYLRTWGFYRAAQKQYDNLDSRSKAIAASYVAGVNAYISTGRLPLEFKILRYQPKFWQPVDGVDWGELIAWDLQSDWVQKIKNYLVAQKLDPSQIDIIFPPYPNSAPTILSTADLRQSNLLSPGASSTQALALQGQLTKEFIQLLSATEQIRAALHLQDASSKGSNNWVVSGKYTTTGKPILVNDPHLDISAPMIWYLVDIKGPNLHVVGASVPGTPVILIGHNDRVAWGETNADPDVQDLYIEPTSVPLKTIVEKINVRGGKTIDYKVRVSPQGPIISDVTEAGLVGPRVALKWTGLMSNNLAMQAILKLDYAKNWNDFTNAMRDFSDPSQNFIYADTKGNIGYFMPGSIPIRNGWTGAFPVVDDAAHQWQGYIPFDKLPHMYNPPEGFIASANNKVVPDDYPYLLTFRWDNPPYRIARIDQLISEWRPLNVEKMRQMQNDVMSMKWRDYRQVLLSTVPLDDASKQALQILSNWQGDSGVDSQAAFIFAEWYKQLSNMMPPFLRFHNKRTEPLFMLYQLRADGSYCHMLGARNCSQLKSITLKNAMKEAAELQGSNMDSWRWGRSHKAFFKGMGFGDVKWLGAIWNRYISAPGDDFTVDVGTYDQETFLQFNGPSYREILDLSNFKNSRYIIPMGQSGNPLSGHYDDFLKDWVTGKYIGLD